MREFDFNDPSVMVKGPMVEAYVNAFGAYAKRGEKVIMRVLRLEGESIDTSPEATYSLMGLLEAIQEVQQQFGPVFMRQMGERVAESALLPPLTAVADLMAKMDAAYQMNHVNGEGRIGSYQWTQTSESSGIFVVDHPWPCALVMGLLPVFVNRLTSNDTGKVTHLNPEECRHLGADICRYKMEW